MTTSSLSSIALAARHIQDPTKGTPVPYWGYVDRYLPCTNDAGSCAYLDLVYASHNRSMLYIGIFWSTVGGVLLLWALWRRFDVRNTGEYVAVDEKTSRASAYNRLSTSFAVAVRRYLLPDGPRWLFGRTSRLQVVILSVLAGYLLIWSFLGISYQMWITPVKNMPGVYNTRTSLGPWSDRVGVLAYGLLPLSILLAQRESVLTLITGVPYHHFNFLHRWLGYIILIQSVLHTIGWTIIEVRLYQPQPSEASKWIRQPYMIWGCVATILILLLWLLTLPPVVRWTGYEMFRKVHYVLAMVFIGACWGHWAHLRCFLIPSLALWAIDRGVRLARTFLLHYNVIARADGTTFVGFEQTHAAAKVFDDVDGGQVVRLDFDQRQTVPWHVGQHFFLTFTDSSVWQSHPMTPLSLPRRNALGLVRHSYVFRAKKGETRNVANIILGKQQQAQTDVTTGILLTGPYGANLVESLDRRENVLCVAGGTGITFVLPFLLHLASMSDWHVDRHVSLVWIVRHATDAEWIRPELNALSRDERISVHIHSTRDAKEEKSDDLAASATSLKGDSDVKQRKGEGEGVPLSSSLQKVDAHIDDHRPNVEKIVEAFLYNTASGPTSVVASGPGSMLSEAKSVVARSNDVRRALRGDERADVRLVSDNRMEW